MQHNSVSATSASSHEQATNTANDIKSASELDISDQESDWVYRLLTRSGIKKN